MTASTAPAPDGAFDRNSVKALQDELREELKDFLERKELSLSFKGGSYDPLRVTLKVELAVAKKNEAGEVMDSYELQFRTYHEAHGFKLSDLGREIRVSGQIAKIEGLETTAKKYPVVIRYIATDKRARVPVKPVIDYIREEDEAKRISDEVKRRKGALGSPNGDDDGPVIETLGDW